VLRKGAKIEKLVQDGKQLEPFRVWIDEEGPGFTLTRSLGDFQSKKIGIISEPEIQHLELVAADRFIVMASDSVWDVMNSAQVAGFVDHHLGQRKTNIAELLVNEVWFRWEERSKAK